VGALGFSVTDYLLALLFVLLALFAVGILLIDFMLPPEMKWANAVTAMIGVLFSAAGVYKIQLWMTASNASGSYGLMRSMLVDHFAIYFFYLFLAATAIAILMSVSYLEPSTKSWRILRPDAAIRCRHDVYGCRLRYRFLSSLASS